MDVYKLRPGLQPVYRIEKDQFESDTRKRFPWYQKNKRGSTSQFAVCPACDNPIQILAMYDRCENSPVCHGRHVRHSVPDVAVYDQFEYDNCRYANPSFQYDANGRRPANSPRGRSVLQLLRQQFDRVICILTSITGIRISDNLARKMLNAFLGMRGHLYIGTTLCNLPWMFGYMANSHSLFGQIVKDDTPLARALQSDARIQFSEYGQIKSATDAFLDINFCFMHHATAKEGVSTRETVKFVVSVDRTDIYEEVVTVQPMLFHDLINLSPGHVKRNVRLLAIAEEILPGFAP